MPHPPPPSFTCRMQEDDETQGNRSPLPALRVTKGDRARHHTLKWSVSRSTELTDPKIVIFVKNGDTFFQGIRLNISTKVFRTMEMLLAELSKRIDLPSGVRHIYTPTKGHRITDLHQFEHHKTYVCASTERFKPMNYEDTVAQNWVFATKSNGQPMVDSSARFGQSTSCFGLSGTAGAGKYSVFPSLKAKKTSYLNTSWTRQRDEPVANYQHKSAITDLGASFYRPGHYHNKPSVITVIRNGPPPRKMVRVPLSWGSIDSWTKLLTIVGDNIAGGGGDAPLLRLFTADGKEVLGLSQLGSQGPYIAVGREKFSVEDFLLALETVEGKWGNPGYFPAICVGCEGLVLA